jgi:peptide/nickel transport system permease protein
MWIVPVMLGVYIIVFSISYFTPGDVVTLMLGSEYTEEQYAAKAAEFGLDKGYFTQLGTNMLKLITKFDLGKSYLTNIPVTTELANRIPISFRISLLCILLMVAVGLPLGIISALRQYSTLDFGLTTVSLIMAAIPQFVLALLCALFFGVVLRWFPVTGLDNWKSWVLPVFCSAGMGIAIFTRMSRTTMLEVIRQDYIRTARAKGLNESVVVTRHALKNCLITLTTTLGAQVARMFSGSIIVETIFAIPGIGTYMMNGITSRDYPIVTGSIFVISLLVCTVNLTVDIVYAFIDPRIKAQFVGAAMKMKYVKALREREAS